MAEYIDREKLLSDIEKYHLSDGKFQHWVEIQPTVDVEHVIRCKDCHYSRELNREDPKERQFIEGCVWCMNWEYGVFPDDYCSNAKKKENINGDKNN